MVPLGTALMRGLGGRCPRCGRGRLLERYLKMRLACDACRLDLEPYRADDAPAYFTIFIVGHIVVPSLLIVEKLYHPASWLQMAIWLPATLVLSLLLLPRVKGATIAAIWRNKAVG